MSGKYWDCSWNVVAGCTKCSPGCDHCWAEAWTRRQTALPYGLGLCPAINSEGKWSGQIILRDAELDRPLRWRKPRVVFVSIMADLFHELVPVEFLWEVFVRMEECRQHTFLVCTKRAARMASVPGIGPLDNVLLGVTVEDQQHADERLPHLARLAAAGWRTWVSYEPALGPVDWSGYFGGEYIGLPGDRAIPNYNHIGLAWLVAGGETGPHARPCHPDWIRAARDQCQAAGVPFWFKGWGEWKPAVRDGDCCELRYRGRPRERGWEWYDWPDGTPVARLGARRAGRELDGREWSERP